jgi:hypothetical protein
MMHTIFRTQVDHKQGKKKSHLSLTISPVCFGYHGRGGDKKEKSHAGQRRRRRPSTVHGAWSREARLLSGSMQEDVTSPPVAHG